MAAAPRALLTLLLPFVAAGCLVGGSDEDATFGRVDLPAVVLAESDLPQFSLFDAGRQSLSDQPGDRVDLQRFGRLGGWKTRYRRGGDRDTTGLLVVESRADLFADSTGAAEEFGAVRAGLGARPGRFLAAPSFGDEAVAYTETQGSGDFTVRHFVIAWRVDNLVAQLSGNGFEGKTEPEDALALARAQQRRVVQAGTS